MSTTPKTLDIIKASARDLQSTDPAKKARALEIKKRYEAGVFNDKLVAEGAKPVPLKTPKVDLSKADITKLPQVAPGPMTKAPTAPVIADVGQDVGEMFKGLGETVGKAYEGAKKIVKDKDFNVAQKTMGVLGEAAGGVSGVIGELITGAGKAVLTQNAEDALKGVAEKIGQGVAETDTAKGLVDWYGSLDKNDKLVVDSAGGIAALMADVFTGGAAPKVLKTGVEATGTALKTIEQGGEALMSKVPDAINAVTPETKGMSEGIIDSINKIDPNKRVEFKQMTGKSEGEWLRERGIIGNREDTVTQLVTNYQAVRKNVDEAIEKMPGTYRDPRVTKVVDEAAEFASKTEGKEAGVMSTLAEKAKGVGLTPAEINQVKRFYERNIKLGYMKDPTKTAEAVTLATNRDNDIREFLFEVADKNGFSNLRELNKEIQASRTLADSIAGKMEKQGSNNIIGLTDTILLSPALLDPKAIAGLIGKKILSTEGVKAFVAKALAGFPEMKPLPRADLDEITKRAQEILKKQEDIKVETEKAALIQDEIKKAGFITGPEGTASFITDLPIPITQQEQALIRAAKNRDEQLQIVKYLLEQRDSGKAVGEGFTMQDIDNVPILNPQSRFDPNKMDKSIEF